MFNRERGCSVRRRESVQCKRERICLTSILCGTFISLFSLVFKSVSVVMHGSVHSTNGSKGTKATVGKPSISP